MTSDEPAVWVFLVERGLDAGSDIQLFRHEVDAIEAARAYLTTSLPIDDLPAELDVYEVIEATNQLAGNDKYIVLAQFPIVSPR